MDVKDYIRTIPDFPQKGVMFRDVTTVLQDARGLELAVDSLAGLLDGVEFDVLIGIESRGFLFGTPIAYKLKKPCPCAKRASCRLIPLSRNIRLSTAAP